VPRTFRYAATIQSLTQTIRFKVIVVIICEVNSELTVLYIESIMIDLDAFLVIECEVSIRDPASLLRIVTARVVTARLFLRP